LSYYDSINKMLILVGN